MKIQLKPEKDPKDTLSGVFCSAGRIFYELHLKKIKKRYKIVIVRLLSSAVAQW
jgi:hypothetical protein